MDRQFAAERFRSFGEVEAKISSPIYADLALRISEDPALLEVACLAPASQPLPNLFFASVQYLLRPTSDEIRAGHLPEEAFERLRTTVLSRIGQMERLLTTRLVQTNEVRRSILIYCAIVAAANHLPELPIACVEIGCSAGFNLLFDQYEFRFDKGEPFGRLGSRLQIFSELKGPGIPPTTPLPFEIVDRTGIDLNPIDVTDEGEVEWLRALIWPEHEDRRRLLDQAIQIRRTFEIETLKGDAVEVLQTRLDEIPEGVTPVVFHTFVANQMSADSKAKLVSAFEWFGEKRNIAHIHNHLADGFYATIYREGRRIEMPLGNFEGHARWIEWPIGSPRESSKG